MIDRRTFVSGSALVVLTPALRFMPADMSAADPSGFVLKIEGWSTPCEDLSTEEIWISINRSGRAVWR
jgi:hypothetical protein